MDPYQLIDTWQVALNTSKGLKNYQHLYGLLRTMVIRFHQD